MKRVSHLGIWNSTACASQSVQKARINPFCHFAEISNTAPQLSKLITPSLFELEYTSIAQNVWLDVFFLKSIRSFQCQRGSKRYVTPQKSVKFTPTSLITHQGSFFSEIRKIIQRGHKARINRFEAPFRSESQISQINVVVQLGKLITQSVLESELRSSAEYVCSYVLFCFKSNYAN